MGKLIHVSCVLVVLQIVKAAPAQQDKTNDLLFGNWDENEDSHNDDGAVWERSDKFEGDMVLTSEQEKAILDVLSEKETRNGLIGVTKRWPNNVVIYQIREDDFETEQVKMIETALEDISNHSCISFKRREKDDDHAVVIQGTASGCFSSVGYNADDEGADQVLNLAKGCFRHGTIVHEMLHTLGFYHMQSTYDRDDYVKIEWDNIIEGTEHNFAKYNNDTVTDFGVSYDYDSVMHYGETAFSKNGNRTIVPLQDGAKIGQRNTLSDKDVLKLNRMYCDKSIDNKINHRF